MDATLPLLKVKLPPAWDHQVTLSPTPNLRWIVLVSGWDTSFEFPHSGKRRLGAGVFSTKNRGSKTFFRTGRTRPASMAESENLSAVAGPNFSEVTFTTTRSLDSLSIRSTSLFRSNISMGVRFILCLTISKRLHIVKNKFDEEEQIVKTMTDTELLNKLEAALKLPSICSGLVIMPYIVFKTRQRRLCVMDLGDEDGSNLGKELCNDTNLRELIEKLKL